MHNTETNKPEEVEAVTEASPASNPKEKTLFSRCGRFTGRHSNYRVSVKVSVCTWE